MTGTTYFCTDSHGHSYSRYSAQHRQPQYTHASIERGAGFTGQVGKANVTYSRLRSGAQAAADRAVRNGYYDYKTRTTKPIAAEVVEVRAYQGRHKVEPATDDLLFDPVTGLTFAEGRARAQALREGRFASLEHEADALRHLR